MSQRQDGAPCRAGFDDVVIYADGYIAVCEQAPRFGYLEQWDWDLARAWNSVEVWRHRALTNRCACINGCNISTHLDILGQASRPTRSAASQAA